MVIKRDIHLKKLIDSKHNGMIKIVTGVRRCGKSYLLFNLFCQHLKEVGITDDHIIKVDLENRRNKELRDPDALLNYIDNHMTDQQMYYILLDEVQHVNEFEDVLLYNIFSSLRYREPEVQSVERSLCQCYFPL